MRIFGRIKGNGPATVLRPAEPRPAHEPARGLKASLESVGLWERHEVARRFEDHKTLIDPQLGPNELDCHVLFTEDRSQAPLVLTAPPSTEGYEKLQLLAELGHGHFAGVGS
jgi:hypothetical protein